MKTNVFHENCDMIYPEGSGAWQSFKVKKHLVDSQSPFQKIDVFETPEFGKVLVLDGVVQCTELDEYIYHEMLVHVPMFSHPEPRRVLIIGGGDGGCLREVLKHDSVELVSLVDIDQMVIDIGRKHFNAGPSFDDSRVEIVIDDAADFIQSTRCRRYDVIIVDGTDHPTENGKSLYSRTFMTGLTKIANKNAVISMMAGVPMAQGLGHFRELNKIMDFMGYKPELYTTTVPSYYGGLTAMYLYTKAPRENFCSLERAVYTKHYHPDLHEASFVLPMWLEAMTDGK